MKKTLFFISWFIVTELAAQPIQRSVLVQMDQQASTYFSPEFRDTALNAYKLVSTMFSSKEFQEQVAVLSFKCQAFGSGCNKIILEGNRIPGKVVLDKLFAQPQIIDTLHLQQSGDALGDTKVNTNVTNAYYEQIKTDMPELPFTYSLAINICHEYMHSLGFVHLYCSGPNPFCRHLHEKHGQPDPYFINDDVTYRIGWIAYYLLKNIYKRNSQAK